MTIHLQKVEFIKSAADKNSFICDALPKVVFAGRSNVGKSSVINRLLGRKRLARVSAVPGKTAHVNYFLVDQQFYLVDLPGYGFARVSHTERQRWALLMENYFAQKEQIACGVVIVDARHRPTADDITMVRYFRQTQVPFCVVANKVDKLKKSQLSAAQEEILRTLELKNTPLFLHSAETGVGREELLDWILESTMTRKEE